MRVVTESLANGKPLPHATPAARNAVCVTNSFEGSNGGSVRRIQAFPCMLGPGLRPRASRSAAGRRGRVTEPDAEVGRDLLVVEGVAAVDPVAVRPVVAAARDHAA